MFMGYRILVCTSTGQSSFSLVYRAEVVLSVERAIPTLRVKNYEQGRNEELLRADLDLLEEERIMASAKNEDYRIQMAKGCNKGVRERTFQVGSMVLRQATLNTKDPKDEKLVPNWEGPCVIVELRKNRSYGLKEYDREKVPRP